MACVLARPASYSNPFTEGQLQNPTWDSYDWASASSASAPPTVEVGSSSKDLGCNEMLKWQGNTCNSAPERHDEAPVSPKVDMNESKKGLKRKASECDFEEILRPPKRISPFFNTPKERKEERRKILKISIQKIRLIENAENSLRRSVLINNTMKKMRHDLKKDSYTKKRKQRLGSGMLNNDCISESYMVDDPFLSGVHEKITDDMTDVLMRNLEKKLGVQISARSENISSSENSPVPTTGEASEVKTTMSEPMDYNEKSVQVPANIHPVNVDSEDKSTISDNVNKNEDVMHNEKKENVISRTEQCDITKDAIKVKLPSHFAVTVDDAIGTNSYSETNLTQSERTR